MAAGVTLDAGNVHLFRGRLNELAQKTLKAGQLQPSLAIDAQVDLAELTMAQVVELGRLNPVGQGNQPVRLAVAGLSHRQPPQRMGRESQHVKFRVTDGKRMLEAVWWNGGGAPWPADQFELAVTVDINNYKGQRNVQLKVLDWRSPGMAGVADERCNTGRL